MDCRICKIREMAQSAEDERCKNDNLKGLDNPILDKWNVLKKIGEYVRDEQSNRMVFHVRSFPLFIQAIGSVKYNCAKSDKGEESGFRIVYRGQNSLMPSTDPFQPSLYRKHDGRYPKQENVDRFVGTAVSLLQKYSENMGRLDKRVVEGVIQHYGAGSRWIDAVDNIWTALWFACHKVWAGNKNASYVHYERRNPYLESAQHPYCYVLLLGVNTSGMTDQKTPGLMGNSRYEFLDLRYALPSFYIRPHVQHGVLVRSMDSKGHPKFDMSDLLKSVIRIDLKNALDWIGNGGSFATSSMFPAPAFDTGFDELLRTATNMKSREAELLWKGKNCTSEETNELNRLKKHKLLLQTIC